jgi:mannose-6-phosphate isomerase-like protein (cupin superfamily)
MKRKNLQFENGFHVVLGNQASQAAEMVLPPGDAEGGAENRHRGADQWLYVLSGTGIATVNGKRYRLGEGSLMLIERGDEHEIRIPVMTCFVRSISTYPQRIPMMEKNSPGAGADSR